MKRQILLPLFLVSVLFASLSARADDIGTGFTYQGELLDGGAPVTGDCDFEFTLWDDPAAGVAVGSVVADTIELTDGKFTTVLDFGAGALNGDARWLEIDVCCPSPCSPTFTTLSPRQELTPSPHALALRNLYTNPVACDSIDACGTNIVGGWRENSTGAGVAGAVVLGGGRDTFAGTPSPNSADGDFASVLGGLGNEANGPWSTILGGKNNKTEGQLATVAGGLSNEAGGNFSLAAGFRAKVRDQSTVGDLDGDEGTFVWGDHTISDFVSTGPNQFLIRASGGVGIGTNAPTDPLTVNGMIRSMTGGFKLPDGTIIDAAGDLGTGDITAVTAGIGLSGGGTSGSVTLNVDYSGTGAANSSARGDHYHNTLTASDGAPADVVFVNASGDVGVGTLFPDAKLEVAGSFQVDGTTFNIDPINNYVGIRTTTPAAPLDVAGFAYIDGPVGIATDTPTTTLDVNGSFRADVQTLVVDAVNNRVGVGTGVPGTTLDVFGNFEVGDLVNTVLRTDLGNNQVGVGTATPSATLDVAGSLEVDGNTLYVDPTQNRVGIGTTSPNSTLEVVGSLRADTNTFFVDSANDRVGIGTLTPSAALDVVGSLEVDGSTLYVNSTSNRVGIGTTAPTDALHVVGDACVTGTIGVCSDQRYKTDIATIDHAMTLIDRVRGVHFNWRRDEYPDRKFSDKPQIGFIAQEVAEVLPEVVKRDDDGYYWVDYGRLTPVLVEAIKEQARSLEEQKRSIESKDRQLAALADRIERLERAMAHNKGAIHD